MLVWNVNALISPREWHTVTKKCYMHNAIGWWWEINLWHEYLGENLE